MNSVKKIAWGITALATLAVGNSFAQGGYFEDALRYSQFKSTGSARIMGLGGAQTSLGGDISNIHSNPAGLGFFRRSEFSFTASYGNWESQTTFLNQVQNDSKNSFSLPNLGVVISSVKGPLETGDWRGGSFGISYNRSLFYTNDFGYFSNTPGNSSLLDYYIDFYTNNGEPALGATDGLPLDVFLIQKDRDVYVRDTLALDNPFQDELIENEGHQTQINFSYGGNYKNKLFVGASIGITSINFRSTKTYNEEFFYRNSENTSLYYSLQENLSQNGTGVDLSLGVIYKPIDNLNLGLSFKSPTWMRINDEFDADIIAEFYDIVSDPEVYEEVSDLYLTTINLRSPMKVSVGGSFFFNKNGFITADVDYVDYSSMRLSSPDFSMNNNNNHIRTRTTTAINYRAGAEYRFNMFRVRAGVAYYGDPMEDPSLDRSIIQYSGGVGVRLAKMYVDLGIIHSNYNSYYTSFPGASLATTDNKQLSGLLTFGFNF